jgi:hypothetical protein
MINEHLRQRLRKDRHSTTITVRIPADILEFLEPTASARGFNSYQTLLKSYISDGLRRDETEVALQTAGDPSEGHDGQFSEKEEPSFRGSV